MQSRAAGPTLDYIQRTFVREPDWLSSARAEGERRHPGMQVSPYEGHLLRWLVSVSGARRILEIGTFMGCSTLWMADGLTESGHITALEFAADHAAQAQQHFAQSPHAARITVHHTDAHAWLAAQPQTPQFDMVFIDAEKAGYARYLDAALPLLTPRGWIIGDNTLLFGELATMQEPKNAAQQSMQQFNAALANAERFESVLLPTPEGLTVARLK
ncbi:MAG: O-methyltransferase [Rickettsiales bacterium]